MSNETLYLLGTDGKTYKKNGDGTIISVGHSHDEGVFPGFGYSPEQKGLTEEEAKAKSEDADVEGQHGFHCHYAYGPYYNVAFGVHTVGWHTHC